MNTENKKKSPAALIILDGYGSSAETKGNAVRMARTPNLGRLFENSPYTEIHTSGLDVGLPDGQMGNSEVGHMNIGAGRIVYQDLTKINLAIEGGDFYKNEALVSAMDRMVKTSKGNNLHIMGLLSDGGVHSHIDHLKALLQMAKQKGLQQVYVHAFTDGRDTSPAGGREYVSDIQDFMDEIGIGKIATISGRYYAMDRDKRWERTQKAYDAVVRGRAEAPQFDSALDLIESSYAAGITDEFIVPGIIKGAKFISAGDSVIFFNYRPDRTRQIARAILDSDFTGFDREYIETFFVGLTEYDKTIKNIHIAFPPRSLENTLGQIIAARGLKQLRAAETEKYAHVTFFFSGGIELPNPGEDRILVPSPKVATYDLKPEMSAEQLTDQVIDHLAGGEYDFLILNYANPDMVGHTGSIDAVVRAIEFVDLQMGRLMKVLDELGFKYIVTADHGNAETMVNPDGSVMTSHTTNPVPLAIGGCDKDKMRLREGGRLCDLAPTLLEIMGIEQPAEMTGKSLIKTGKD